MINYKAAAGHVARPTTTARRSRQRARLRRGADQPAGARDVPGAALGHADEHPRLAGATRSSTTSRGRRPRAGLGDEPERVDRRSSRTLTGVDLTALNTVGRVPRRLHWPPAAPTTRRTRPRASPPRSSPPRPTPAAEPDHDPADRHQPRCRRSSRRRRDRPQGARRPPARRSSSAPSVRPGRRAWSPAGPAPRDRPHAGDRRRREEAQALAHADDPRRELGARARRW